MTAAVRKKDEELTINIKCTIGVLMTDSGLRHTRRQSREDGNDAHTGYNK